MAQTTAQRSKAYRDRRRAAGICTWTGCWARAQKPWKLCTLHILENRDRVREAGLRKRKSREETGSRGDQGEPAHGPIPGSQAGTGHLHLGRLLEPRNGDALPGAPGKAAGL